MSSYFWFLTGVLSGVAASLIVVALMRGNLARSELRVLPLSLGAFAIIAFSLTALILYRTYGSPELVGANALAVSGSPHPGVTPSADATPDSMDNVVSRLEQRIARGGATRDDWLLLAQSYEFLGRTAEAKRARESAESPATASAPATAAAVSSSPAPPPAENAAEYQRRVQAKPNDADAWRALTSIYRRQHEYGKARDAFAKLVKLKAMDAGAWADYADSLASASGGSLRGESAKAIDAALRLDASQPKALWLKASLAHEEHRYADALAVWRQLRSTLPEDSSDARIVDANIAEAAQLAGVPVPATAATPSTAPAAPAAAGDTGEVSGTVSIDSKLAARVPAGATLFIYAKAADAPGPPLAVLRQVTGSWPVSFRLDDTLAMLPSRKLSQFDRVIVEARISRSGQATPAPGDLYVQSAVLKPGSGKRLALVIDHEVS